MPLTDAACRNARPRNAPYKLSDQHGMFLAVQPSGAKWWRYRYRFLRKEQLLSLGVYPEVNLKLAREKRDEARRLLLDGINPSLHRQHAKLAKVEAASNSFEAIAKEWLAQQGNRWATSHKDKIESRLARNIFPYLGTRAISEIIARDMLPVVRKIEGRGAFETAHRALANCSQVFRYAVVTGRAERNPCSDLHGALTPVPHRHMATITDPSEIASLLRAMDGYQGSEITKAALQLAPLTFVRPGELRQAEWLEFNLDGGEWRIPAHKMKMRVVHIVPLSTQAVAILRELQPLSGRGTYLFPSVRSGKRSMSENTVNAALRRLGYTKEQMTGHGFRSMASTLLNEQGWNRDAIERQLAHAERDEVRAAYNYAEFMPERKKMMQAWADYLDTLKSGRKVLHAAFGRAA